MKKIIPLMIAISTMLISCGSQSSSSSSSVSREKELLGDNRFAAGFNVLPADKSYRDGMMPESRWPLNSELRYGGNDDVAISWDLAQHGCINGLGDIYNQTTSAVPMQSGDEYTFSDSSKIVKVNPAEGSLSLELDASKEYEGARVAYENWPHLILQQGFQQAAQVSDLESMDLSIDLEMSKLENHMTAEEYNPSLHTVQFIMYLVVNSESSLDAGEFLWFGIPFLDYRYTVMDENGQADAGTSGNSGKFIYQMATDSYLPTGLKVGQKEEIRIDIIESLRRALVLANIKGYMTNTTVDELSVSGMNIGFEIPGTFDCCIKISDFSLKTTLK